MEGLYVSCAVLSALLVTGVGHLLVRTGKLSKEAATSISTVSFYVASPAFSFYNLSRTLRLESVVSLIPIALANIATCTLGLALAAAASFLLRLDRHTAVYCVAMSAFANTSSLPLYLARALYPESKEVLYSLETVYSAMQSIIMWGGFYPIVAYWLASRQPRQPDDEMVAMRDVNNVEDGSAHAPVDTALSLTPPPLVDRREVIRRVANPTLIAVVAGVIVGCIQPVQAFLYGPVDFVLAPLLETLGGSQVFLLLLLLGASLDMSSGVAPRKLLMGVIALLRLFIVPAVVFACMVIFKPPSREFAFIVLTAGATPPNLGLLLMFQVRERVSIGVTRVCIGVAQKHRNVSHMRVRTTSVSCPTSWPRQA